MGILGIEISTFYWILFEHSRGAQRSEFFEFAAFAVRVDTLSLK